MSTGRLAPGAPSFGAETVARLKRRWAEWGMLVVVLVATQLIARRIGVASQVVAQAVAWGLWRVIVVLSFGEHRRWAEHRIVPRAALALLDGTFAATVTWLVGSWVAVPFGLGARPSAVLSVVCVLVCVGAGVLLRAVQMPTWFCGKVTT